MGGVGKAQKRAVCHLKKLPQKRAFGKSEYKLRDAGGFHQVNRKSGTTRDS